MFSSLCLFFLCQQAQCMQVGALAAPLLEAATFVPAISRLVTDVPTSRASQRVVTVTSQQALSFSSFCLESKPQTKLIQIIYQIESWIEAKTGSNMLVLLPFVSFILQSWQVVKRLCTEWLASGVYKYRIKLGSPTNTTCFEYRIIL